MRLLYLTPGTGSFYCGTCMRDNALVTQLRRLGHDATLLPLYMPMTLDEPDASEGLPVMMGGVNAYLQQKSALFRATPRWIDQIFDSPAVLAAAGKRAGATAPHDLGDITLSMLQGENGQQRKEVERLAQWAKDHPKPDVICLSNALLLGVGRRLSRELDVPVVCSFQGEDSFLDALPEPFKTRSWQLMKELAEPCAALVAVSDYYAGEMAFRLGLPREKFHVVHNGISLDGFGPAPKPPENPTIGFFARVCPQKGLHTLVDAFILLKRRGTIPNLKLHVAGTRASSDESYVKEQVAKLQEAGVGDDAEFLPTLSRPEKIEFLQSLSALSVPATYGEAFGLYVIESLACGVPVVQPRSGAFPELIEATGGGVLFEPGSAESLADELEKLLANPDSARAMGKCGREAVLRDFSAARMAQKFAAVLEG